MSAVAVVWTEFLACAAIIAVAGASLSRYGDIIAEKTGMGGAWVGLVLLATVTSLPELVTGVSAVTLADAPDIAVGNVLGACVINLTMIVFLDLLQREESIFTRIGQGHILSAGFGTIMAGFVGSSVLFAQHGDLMSFYTVGIYTPMLFVLYAVAIRTLFRYERATRQEAVEERVERYPKITLRQAAWRYALAAVVVVAVGLWLPYVARDIAHVMAWQETFVGTLFVALATTLPEIAVTLSALRIGAVDLAVSNLLGSNLFNLLLIGVDDLAYLKGPLLSHVSDVHAVSALSVVMMCGVAVVSFIYRPRTRLFKTVGWASLMLLSIYLLNTFFHYLYSG
ncbi:MAG TPA: sodium:calcium antiporter [Burkholderiales bacterium]|nr:sodium:calcium antiporter [Burkholderiales bacterium]